MINCSKILLGCLFLCASMSAALAQSEDPQSGDPQPGESAAGLEKGSQEAPLPMMRRADFWEKGRPANSFQLGSIGVGQDATDTCTKILSALNEPWPWPDDIKKSDFEGWFQVLTGNRYAVNWKRPFYEADIGDGIVRTIHVSPRTITDIDNDGQLDVVYRFPLRVGGIERQYLVASTILPPSDEVLWTPERRAEVLGPDIRIGAHIKITLGRLTFANFAIRFASHLLPKDESDFLVRGQFKNIVVLDSVNFVLVGSGYQFNSTKRNPPSIRVFKPRGYYSHDFQCEILHRYNF